jgi:pentatricopeptide repeat protein
LVSHFGCLDGLFCVVSASIKIQRNAWSKSGQKIGAAKKCEDLLDRMIDMAEQDGRPEIKPNTVSFNIVLNALAQGRERNSGARAEALLQKMEQLDAQDLKCSPDETSFNTVLNGWAKSRLPGAAQRATAILEHMGKRYDAGLTLVHPSSSTFATVLKAWVNSRDPRKLDEAEAVFQMYQQAIADGKWGLSHGALAYNTMINCYAKSRRPDASDRAFEIFQQMKANAGKPGWELCFVDVYTYTSLIDALTARESYEASEQAISLLEEVERSYRETGDKRFQPNVQLYTSVVNAIGRSHKDPERAQAIVDRVETAYLEGLAPRESKPDVILYNALINAFGWSNMEGKSQKCYQVLQHMIDLSESGKLPDAKPDTISFNSVLNACGYEKPNSFTTHEDIMKIVVETFELLKQGHANSETRFGKPDHNTYAQVLISINNHMDENDEKRISMAETAFLQCANDGLVGPQIVGKLEAALPHQRFQELMGQALFHKDSDEVPSGRKQYFDLSKLPRQWTANTPRRKGDWTPPSRSRRRQNNYQVTKNVLSKNSKLKVYEKDDRTVR